MTKYIYVILIGIFLISGCNSPESGDEGNQPAPEQKNEERSVQELQSGAKYFGEWNGEKRHGWGITFHKDGQVKEQFWKDGQPIEPLAYEGQDVNQKLNQPVSELLKGHWYRIGMYQMLMVKADSVHMMKKHRKALPPAPYTIYADQAKTTPDEYGRYFAIGDRPAHKILKLTDTEFTYQDLDTLQTIVTYYRVEHPPIEYIRGKWQNVENSEHIIEISDQTFISWQGKTLEYKTSFDITIACYEDYDLKGTMDEYKNKFGEIISVNTMGERTCYRLCKVTDDQLVLQERHIDIWNRTGAYDGWVFRRIE